MKTFIPPRAKAVVRAVFQALESGTASFSKPWKKQRFRFPMLGKVAVVRRKSRAVRKKDGLSGLGRAMTLAQAVSLKTQHATERQHALQAPAVPLFGGTLF